MAVLVAGGAGYIGSHNARLLLEQGQKVVVVDNLRTGHKKSLPPGAIFYEADIRDGAALDAILDRHQIDAVLHFAASSLVAESMERPLAYFDNNVGGMISLLSAMRRHKLDKIVFSSSAAVYGQPDKMPISEDAPLRPTNPYGESKLAMERFMHWAAEAHHMRHVILRYFNVAGAWPDGRMGEDHRPESHLVPLILQVPAGLRTEIKIFGDDYPTRDGTCVRDYLDVNELAEAHMLALDYLRHGGQPLICNLGSERGFSVREVVGAARKITGHPIPEKIAPRRPGDPAMLVASSARAREVLGWRPRRSIEEIVRSAWKWHKAHPQGYDQ